MRSAELITLLQAHHIPLDQWDKGEAKSLYHLLDEVNAGEAKLKVDGNVLVRFIYPVAIDVFFLQGNTRLWLKEREQIFADGRRRQRHLSTSLGEKMKTGEQPAEVVERALREELGIREKAAIVQGLSAVNGPLPSSSFPGLLTLREMHFFQVTLPAAAYRPHGYVERQPDKTTFFVWKKDLRACAI